MTEKQKLVVYTASITSNPEIRKQCQRAVMLMEGLQIPCDIIDITKPENTQHRQYMREEGNKAGLKIVLPPQFFYDNEYLGSYQTFDEAVEMDRLEEFLRLPVEWKQKRTAILNDENNAPGGGSRDDIKG